MATHNTELAHQASTDLAQPADSRIRVAPPVDIYENKDEILVVADLPGVSPEAATVRLDGAELIVEGGQPESQEGDYQAMYFYRAFRVPNTIDPNGVRAEHKNGVLTVHLAKSDAAKPRRIEVRAG